MSDEETRIAALLACIENLKCCGNCRYMTHDMDDAYMCVVDDGADEFERQYFTDRYVALYHYETDCPAYRSLSPCARALLVEFKRRYNGRNNGQIHFSARDMAERLGVKKTKTAINAAWELQAKGFIKVIQLATFDTRKQRRASEYELTCSPVPGEVSNAQPASKEFMRWKAEADNFPIRKAPPRKGQVPKTGPKREPLLVYQKQRPDPYCET